MGKKKKKFQMTEEMKKEASEKLQEYEKKIIRLCPENLEKRQNRLIIQKKPGCYKWWAEQEQLNVLLEKLVESPENRMKVKELLEHDNDMYCIYVGQASSIRKRLNNHVNRTMGSSTLRQSIGSLIANLGKDNKCEIEKKVNAFIEKLEIRYFFVDKTSELDSVEWVLINGKNGENVFRLLNIERNEPKEIIANAVVKTLGDMRSALRSKIPIKKKKNR
jgi:hypothetical protein